MLNNWCKYFHLWQLMTSITMSSIITSTTIFYKSTLSKWYKMYVKNLNFDFEKNWNSLAAASPEKQTPSPPLLNRLPPKFQQLFSPHLLIKNIYIYKYIYIYIYICTVNQSGCQGHPLWLDFMLETFLEISTTRLNFLV